MGTLLAPAVLDRAAITRSLVTGQVHYLVLVLCAAAVASVLSLATREWLPGGPAA